MLNYVWLIIFVAGVILSFWQGKKAELRSFCKELGEGFAALDEFLGKFEEAGNEAEKIAAAEKLRKEWLDVIKAGGALFHSILLKTYDLKYKRQKKM